MTERIIKNWDETIEELINKSVIGYRILTLDLSKPRYNEPYEIRGNFLQVLDIPDNPPKIEIIFNELFDYPLPIKAKEQYIYPFRRFYITNEAGQGFLQLFIGKNFELTPYAKLTSTGDIGQKLDDIKSKLTDIYTAVDELEIKADTINLNTDELETKLDIIAKPFCIPQALNCRTQTISGNQYVQLLPSRPDGRFFGIANLSETDSIYVQFPSAPNEILLLPKTSFSIDNKPLTNAIYVNNITPNNILISYWWMDI